MSAVVPWWPVAVYGASRCSLKPDVVSTYHMNEWLAAHPDVIRTDFKRKLRYPAVDRRTVVREPVLIEDNKLTQRLSARAYAWLRRVARLYKPYEADMPIPQHLLTCDRFLVECDRCIQEARAYLKARRQTVDEYINL
jgi:hypothetical protein